MRAALHCTACVVLHYTALCELRRAALCVLCCTAWHSTAHPVALRGGGFTAPLTLLSVPYGSASAVLHRTCLLCRTTMCVLCRTSLCASCCAAPPSVRCAAPLCANTTLDLACCAALHCAANSTALCMPCYSAPCVFAAPHVCGVRPCTVCAVLCCSALCCPPQCAAHCTALRRPGRDGGHQIGKTPRLWPFCARPGGWEGAGQVACPGCGRFAHAGAGEELVGGGDAPVVAGSRTLGWKGGHLTGRTPRLWPVCAYRGGRGARDRHLALVVAGARTPGREGDT